MTCVDDLPHSRLLTLNDVMPFGKYKGLTIRDVISRDPNYVDWAIKTVGDFKLDEEAYRAFKRIRFW